MKYKLFLIAVILTSISASSYAATKYVPEVHWAGFALAGRYDALSSNFPYLHSIMQDSREGKVFGSIDKTFYQFFHDNAALMKNVRLVFGSESKSKISMAVAVTRENTSTTVIDGLHKLIISLSFNVLFLDYESMAVRAAYPIYIQFIDIKKVPFTPDDVRGKIFSLLFKNSSINLLDLLKKRLPSYQINANAKLTWRIYDVSMGSDALSELKLPASDKAPQYLGILAQRFADAISEELALPIMPHVKDNLNAKMSLVFSDARVQDFLIPESSYALSFRIDKLTKSLHQETPAERAYLFGIYSNVQVYNPDLGTKYFNSDIKHGELYVTPVSQQNVDDYAVYDEMWNPYNAKVITEMRDDKKFNKEVIKRCSVK